MGDDLHSRCLQGKPWRTEKGEARQRYLGQHALLESFEGGSILSFLSPTAVIDLDVHR